MAFAIQLQYVYTNSVSRTAKELRMESIDICLLMGLAGPKQVLKCAVEHSRRHRCLYGCMVLDEQMDCGLMQQSLEIVW